MLPSRSLPIRLLPLACAALAIFVSPLVSPVTTSAATTFAYPQAPKSDHVDDYHGVKVPDPYRPLEDVDAAATATWVAQENALTRSYMDAIPARGKILARLKTLNDYEKFGAPGVVAGRYFFSKNTGLQNQSILYWSTSLDAAPKVLIDPNTLSADGTIALGATSVSDDGKLLAYSTQVSGSDWQTWHVRNIEKGADLSDVLTWTSGGGSWKKDGSGFYYSTYPKPTDERSALKAAKDHQKVWFHKIGTPQSADGLVYERNDQPKWFIGARTSDDGAYLFLTLSDGTSIKNGLLVQDLRTPNAPVKEIRPIGVAQWSVLGNDGSTIYVETTNGAPNGKIVAIDLAAPTTERTLVAESKDAMEGTSLVGNTFFTSYLHDAHAVVRAFDLTGKLVKEIALPGIGSISGFGTRRANTEFYYTYTSYTVPPSVYRFDVATMASTLYRAPKLAFDPNAYMSEQVFYASKDGTKIPLILTYKKGLKKDGTAPTILYAYGGFNISVLPAFSPSRIAWMDMGGIYAVPNIRGGAEYGQAWHEAGMMEKKQNVFDDFIAAAKFLISEKYTSTPKLAISGGSNGGLLVGAAMTQHPELFGAALPAVGVMDMLRFQKFTVGYAWTTEYGNADASLAEFNYLHAYSPLHNIKPGVKYPPTLVSTADHDDRVFPAHSFKFAATLQADQAGPAPVLITIETKAGHGAGKPISKQLEETADTYAFLVKSLGIGDAMVAAATTR